MYDKALQIAYEKSNEIVSLIETNSEKMVSTQSVIDAVQEVLECENISVGSFPFSKKGRMINSCGAMMKTTVENGKIISAEILLNSECDATFQRFSLVHELGHLMTGNLKDEKDILNGTDDNRKFILSTHIDYRISSISEEQYSKNPTLKAEQLANIFALRVLMPEKIFYKKISETDSINKTAEFFGVTSDAVISRLMVG